MNFGMWYHAAERDWFSSFGLVYPGVWIFVFFWVFAFGACIGSFLNVCIWRIPRGESLSKASSHCTVCGADIHWYDNIPIVSYLVLRGKCRSCRTPYSASYFVVELICGVLVALLFAKTGLCEQDISVFPSRMLLIFFGISCAMTDIRFNTVPDKLTFSGIVLALAAAFAFPGAWGSGSHCKSVLFSLLSGILPGMFLFLFSRIGKFLSKREIIGLGDVKFTVLCGMLIGLPGVIFSLFFGSLTGTVYGVIFKRKLGASLAFVPFLVFAALVWIFFDKWLLDGYLSIFNQ